MKPIIFYLLVLTAFLIWNWYMISVQKKSPNHVYQALLRLSTFMIYSLISFHDWPNIITYALSLQLAFWFPFQTGLNLMRGLAWNYISQSPTASLTDRIMRTWPGMYIPLSFLLMIMGLGTLVFGTYF